MNKALNHSYVYVTGSLVQALVPFFILPVLARIISPSQFGLLMLLVSIGTVLSFGFSLGIPAILSRDLIFQQQKSRHLKDVAKSYQSLLIWLSIMFFLFSVYGQQYLTMTIFALSISLAFSLSVIQIKLSILRAEFRSLRFALLAIASTSFPMLMITLISIYRIGNIYFYYVGTSLFLTLILNFNYLFKLPSASTVSTTKKLILIAYPMIFHGMSISLFQYGDKIASFLGLGSEFVAQVVVISLFMTAPMLLLNTINNAWLPTTIELFKKSSVKAFNYLHKSSKNLSIFITIISIGIVIFSKFIVSMFVPNTYNQIEISRAIIIGLSFTPLYVIYLQNTHLFTVAKKFKSMAKITPIAAVIQFIFTFGLVSSIGLSAPAYGLLLAIFVQVVLTTIKAKSLRKLNKLPLYLSIFLSSFNIVYLNFFF